MSDNNILLDGYGMRFGSKLLRDEVVNQFCKGYLAYVDYSEEKAIIPIVNGDVYPRDNADGSAMDFIVSFDVKDFYIGNINSKATTSEIINMSEVKKGAYNITFNNLN